MDLAMDDRTKILCKIMIVGDSGVGKTSLLLRYCYNTFSDAAKFIGCDFIIKRLEVEEEMIELQMWDTAGHQERFRSISGSMYQGSNAVIVVFDLTDEDSFRNVPAWMQEIERYCASYSVLRLLVGNKADLQDRRVISREEAEDMAKRCDVEYVEVSAKTGEGVKEMFDALPPKIEVVRDEIARKAAAREDYTINVVSTARNRPERAQGCCCKIC